MKVKNDVKFVMMALRDLNSPLEPMPQNRVQVIPFEEEKKEVAIYKIQEKMGERETFREFIIRMRAKYMTKLEADNVFIIAVRRKRNEDKKGKAEGN